MKELLLIEDICPVLHIGRTNAYKMIKSGQLHAEKICGKWQIRPEDLQNYLDKCYCESADTISGHIPSPQQAAGISPRERDLQTMPE